MCLVGSRGRIRLRAELVEDLEPCVGLRHLTPGRTSGQLPELVGRARRAALPAWRPAGPLVEGMRLSAKSRGNVAAGVQARQPSIGVDQLADGCDLPAQL